MVTQREGVGIVLDKRATAAWRSAGELWKPVSSRVIMVRLKWIRQRWQTSDETFVTVICTYAPNAKAPPNVRSQFLEQLQDTLDVLRVIPLRFWEILMLEKVCLILLMACGMEL